MITKITGTLIRVDEAQAILQIDAFEYQVLIPEFARRQLQMQLGQPISLHTIHYLDGNPAHGRLTPRIIGFLQEVEREFFELFCSVDGVGARKALRAMVRPVQDVADLIEQQNAKGLSALPGIGPAMAERIIAKLRRKMPKFALLVGRDEKYEAEVELNVVDETFQVLTTLGHSESDARRLLDTVLASKSKFKDVEALLQAVYDQRCQ
ncbi:MAG: Holliday junction DNA helicase RuvA [Planctomycetaceae bacterium]|nr:MAG: Holliday junction DNA helicase RuvA [Planctomycetaceae bacterium]